MSCIRPRSSLIVLIAALFLLSCLPADSFDMSQNVSRIVVKGNKRVPEPTIRYHITLKEGEPYSGKKVGEDIRSIYSLSSFDDIKVEVTEVPDGLVVSYLVEEKPFVIGIKIKGAKEARRKEIKDKIEFKEGNFFKKNLLLRDKETIRVFYREKGFYFVGVDIVEKDRGDNQLELEYRIDEGDKIYVSEVSFNGNRHFSDRKLADSIDTKVRGFFSSLTDSGAYRKDLLKIDLLKIESLYKNDGFIKVNIDNPRVEVDEEMGSIYIGFFIDEGEEYHIGDINIERDELFSEKKLRESLKIKEGDIFNRAEFSKGIFSMTSLYLEKGYAFADVIQQTKVNDDSRTVDINLKVDRGEKVYIGDINIHGNKKTRDKVVRREMRFKEGELFDISKLRLSRDRLNRLGYFSKVDIRQMGRAEEDLVDLDINLEETYTGTLNVSAGYSDVENAIFAASVMQRNLFGRGQTLKLNAEFSSIKKDYTLSFLEPYMFDKDFSTGVSLFNNEKNYASYDATENGGGVNLGKSLSDFTRIGLYYQYKNSNTAIDDESTASSTLLASKGEWEFNELTNSISFNNRDDFFNPTRGMALRLKGTYGWGGGPQGDLDYYRLDCNSTHHYPIFWNLITKIGGKVGYIGTTAGKELPIFKNYYLGGSSSLRGFNYDDVGPRDENGETIGGRASLLFNAEIHYPFSKTSRGFLFYDRGQLYGVDATTPSRTTNKNYDIAEMRHSWGVGMSIFSPVGPISLVWGFKLDPIEKEDAMEFHFNIGGSF